MGSLTQSFVVSVSSEVQLHHDHRLSHDVHVAHQHLPFTVSVAVREAKGV